MWCYFTTRLMTAQHNAALNSGTRPQDLLALQQQRRTLNAPAAEMVRPAGVPVVPPAPQTEPPKLQYSPRASVPLQHRPGTFYGHNPNLKRKWVFLLSISMFIIVVFSCSAPRLVSARLYIRRGRVGTIFGGVFARLAAEDRKTRR